MKDKLLGIIIVSLVGYMFYIRGCETKSEAKGPDTLVVHDTTWQEHTKLIVKNVPIIHEIPVNHDVLVTTYQADTSYPKLKVQYEALVKQYAAKRVYVDSVAVGTYGHIRISDTVSENTLKKRTLKENYKIPEVTKTVTITKYAEPTRQLYVGGGINATSLSSFRSIEGGILYKNKRDQIFGGKVGINTDGSVTYGVQSYWKIKLKK